MSEFLKFAFEVLSQVVYNIVTWLVAFAKVFVTGWFEYFVIFKTYFPTLSIVGKVLSVLLMILLAAIPIVIILLLIRRAILNYQLKADKSDNAALYREIGRLNKQVLDLMEEKNSILALKVNAMGGTERIPYMGASALTDDVIPSVGNVTDPGKAVQGAAAKAGAAAIISGTDDPKKAPVVRAVVSSDPGETVEHRFPKLTLVDQKYAAFQYPQYNNDITLEEFVEGYRLFAASQMKLYYTPEIIRRFVAGMASKVFPVPVKQVFHIPSADIWKTRQRSYLYSRPIVTVQRSLVILTNFQRDLMRQNFSVHCMRQIIVRTRL